MSWLQKQAERLLWRIVESRSSLENPQTPLSYPAEWLLDIFSGGRTDSGLRVSEMTALQVGTVLSCVNIISNGIATLPLPVHERMIRNDRPVKRIAHEHELFPLIHDEPNQEMSSHTFRRTLQVHALLWGNAYAEIQRDGNNRVVALWPRNPTRTRPIRALSTFTIQGTKYPAGTLVYRTNESLGADTVVAEDDPKGNIGPERVILAEDMLHMLGLSLDGRLGSSVVYMARQIIGLALATEKYGAKFFGNGAVPRGILTIPTTLEPRALENLRRSWQEAHGGENVHKTAVLEQGVTFQQIASDPEKSQFLATRQFQRIDIAAIFNVPPHMIGEGGRSASGVEQTAIDFHNFTLSPWLHTWEQELNRKLFVTKGVPMVGVSKQFFVKFDVHRLLYPDAAARSAFYSTGKNWGYLSTNDIREREDMNPVDDASADKYWLPMNMQDASDPLTVGPKAAAAAGAEPTPVTPVDKNIIATNDRMTVATYCAVYRKLFRDAFGRIARRENRNPADWARTFKPVLYTVAEQIAVDRSKPFDPTVPIFRAIARLAVDYVALAEDDVVLDAVAKVETEQLVSMILRYSEDQPRDPDGKFGSGSGEGAGVEGGGGKNDWKKEGPIRSGGQWVMNYQSGDKTIDVLQSGKSDNTTVYEGTTLVFNGAGKEAVKILSEKYGIDHVLVDRKIVQSGPKLSGGSNPTSQQ